jgi:DNA-binding phage protein
MQKVKLSPSGRREALRPPADPDLVDRLFEFLSDHPRLPEFPPEVLAQVKADLRSEFRDEVRRTSPLERQQRVHQVLELFNGRNASEVARSLGIGRATVYRYLKQQGGRPPGAVIFRVAPADRLTFPGNETPAPIPSDSA